MSAKELAGGEGGVVVTNNGNDMLADADAPGSDGSGGASASEAGSCGSASGALAGGVSGTEVGGVIPEEAMVLLQDIRNQYKQVQGSDWEAS